LISLAYLLAIAAEAVAHGDFESRAVAALATRERDACTDVSISANLNWVFWKSMIAFPNCKTQKMISVKPTKHIRVAEDRNISALNNSTSNNCSRLLSGVH
jgi:hypothetical protein